MQRIETLVRTPHLEAVFLPWRGSDEVRKDLLAANNTPFHGTFAADTCLVPLQRSCAPDALIIDWRDQ